MIIDEGTLPSTLAFEKLNLLASLFRTQTTMGRGNREDIVDYWLMLFFTKRMRR
jgi:hypothetical protein